MERLTIRNSDGSVSQPTGLNWAAALERLAAYEDTGLEPRQTRSTQLLWRSKDCGLKSALQGFVKSYRPKRRGGAWCCRARWGTQCGGYMMTAIFLETAIPNRNAGAASTEICLSKNRRFACRCLAKTGN